MPDIVMCRNPTYQWFYPIDGKSVRKDDKSVWLWIWDKKASRRIRKKELEADRRKLNKWNFYQDIKTQFKKNIDELHNKFYDEFNENITFEQQYIIRKFADFLKQNV